MRMLLFTAQAKCGMIAAERKEIAAILKMNLRTMGRRLGASLAILLVIAYLTLFGLLMAERGRAGLPAEPLNAAGEALSRTAAYLTNHPTTYYWARQEVPALQLVLTLFSRSAGLLLVALGMAAALGVSLGVLLAIARRFPGAPLVLLLSILGVSTPSFLLAMLFWVVDIQLYRQFGVAPLPPTGFGWDEHLVLPALVLATRPLAQIVQITYVAMSDVLGQDYIRTAQAKGLRRRVVLSRHALRNILIPILTTLGTSLRFSLASLPVVEYFFIWPGVGLALLQAIESGLAPLVTDLIVSLGLLFLLVNLALETIYPLLAPQTKQALPAEGWQARYTWRDRLADLRATLREWLADLRQRLAGLRRPAPTKAAPSPVRPGQAGTAGDAALPASPSSRRVRSLLANPPLIVGTLLILAFFGLALFGPRLTTANPYATHGIIYIGENIASPPFPPSASFPWGSDPVGRDIQALVLAGAKQTLALALFATVARLILGSLLGLLAGWWRGGWLDRLVTDAIAVWAAFPVTLFAMIFIQALGIQEGMWVFVVALCVVGWGEIAQFVRGQVIGIKPKPYIEAARSLGARSGRLLTQHVFPQLLPSLLVLVVMEMGAVLMLLAELGFLNIFLGGGFKVMIGEMGRMVPIIYFFSDVPEWGALLANIRNWWRSYPWMAWYPGLAFFLAILAFNLAGEGLRRWLEEARVNVGRLFNRYTLSAAAVLVLGLFWVLRSTAPLEMYSAQAEQFQAQKALADIQELASPQFQGRETGRPGCQEAAAYIARRMEEVGLSPGGENNTYFQSFKCPRFHLTEVPRLEIVGGESFIYRQDFVEYVGQAVTAGNSEATVIGVVFGPDPGTPTGDPYGLGKLGLYDKVIIVRQDAPLGRINIASTAGMLVITDDPATLQRKYVFPRDSRLYERRPSAPLLYISQEVAEKLLATAGSSLAELNDLAKGLEPGQVALTAAGATVHLSVAGLPDNDPNEMCYNVIGFIPGTGALTGPTKGQGLDTQVIMVSAYYDGLGLGPEGTLYPGANDNASGVAMMLEMARVLKQSPYQPKKTVVFAAWAEGERGESLSLTNVMNAKPGFGLLTVEAVIELSGVGAGDGQGIALGQGSSFRLTQLYKDAADRLGVATTTRGRGPHFDLPVRTPFGGRSAMTAYVSWDGADRLAHTAGDTVETISVDKLRQVGQTTLLVLTVLSREVEY